MEFEKHGQSSRCELIYMIPMYFQHTFVAGVTRGNITFYTEITPLYKNT